MTNSEVSNELPDRPASDNELPDRPTSDKEQPEQPPSDRNLKSRLRARLQLIGGALASFAAVGAVAGGLVGYWNVWKTVRTDVYPESLKTQREATARPDIAPRLSLVVLPFANLNNDPEQDYFADGIATDLTTDLAQTPGAFVIGRGTAFTYKNKQIDFKTLGKELGIRWAVQGAVRRNGDQVRVNVSLTDLSTGRDIWSDRFDGDRTNVAALQDQITARLARSLNIELIQAESRRSEADRSRNPEAMDFIMRGWACAEEIGHTLTLGLWDNHGPTVIRIEEAGSVHVNMRVGSVMSLLGTPTGRVFAAFLPAKMIETFSLRQARSKHWG